MGIPTASAGTEASFPVTTRWHAFDTAEALHHDVCLRVLTAADAAIAARGRFLLVIPGGDTPQRTFRRLRVSTARWSQWHVYFGDERCLPETDVGRNSLMADDAWLGSVPIPRDQIHVIRAERGAHAAAAAYAEQLRDVGEFDLVLLGLGDDGHTASLFPGHAWGNESSAPDVLAIEDAPKPPPQRVSLSAARLGRARSVLFLVSGVAKRDAVARWRAGDAIPASAIQPACGVDVLVDSAATGLSHVP